MQFITDENVHGKVVARLRERGYSVVSIKTIAMGATDADILRRADVAQSIFITNDRDFGALVFDRKLPTPMAILYTRIPHRNWELTAGRVIATLERGVQAGHLVTITEHSVRARPFSTGADNA